MLLPLLPEPDLLCSSRFELCRTNGIAHFLFEADAGNFHVNLSDGAQLQNYSISSAILLGHVARKIDVLRQFYSQHIEGRIARGMLLPMPENRDQFVVRDPQMR